MARQRVALLIVGGHPILSNTAIQHISFLLLPSTHKEIKEIKSTKKVQKTVIERKLFDCCDREP